MKTKRLVTVVIVLSLLVQIFSVVPVEAATKKKASSNATYVTQVNRNGGLVGIPTKIRKNIKNKISRWEFTRIMLNLYEGRIKVASTWIDETTLNQSWACGILTSVSAQLGVKVNWSGGSSKAKVDLGTACKLIVLTINSSPKLKPTKWT